jgi:hypothetical protein
LVNVTQRAMLRIKARVEDLVRRIGDDKTQVKYSVAG